MKKQCNRALAMLLALVTMLSVLPISAIAAPWLEVEQETTKKENVTTNDITVTLDAKALLGYLKDRDMDGLLAGLSVNGLGDVISTEVLLEIIPEEKIVSIIEAVEKDVTPEMLLQYMDVEELLRVVDRPRVIELITEIDNIQDYIKDYAPIADEISTLDIDAVIDYIDAEALVNDYAKELLHLALDHLTNAELLEIVDVEAALELQDIDVYEALDQAVLRDVVTYERLFGEFVHDEALKAFVTEHLESWDQAYLEHFVHIDELKQLMLDLNYIGMASDFVHVGALQAYLANVSFTYEMFKSNGVISESALIAVLEHAAYDEISSYLTTDEALLQNTLETMSGKDMEADFDTFWCDYLIDDGSGNYTLNTSKFFAEQPVDYGLLINSGALNVTAMLADLNGAYNFAALDAQGAVDLPSLLSSRISGFTISELEHAGAISYREIIFGKPGVNGGEPLFTYAELVDHELLDFGLLIEGDGDIPPFFTINELYLYEHEGVHIIKASELYSAFGAETLVDLDNLKAQLLFLLDHQRLTTADVIECIIKDGNGNIDYVAVIEALHGVKYVVDNTGLTYETVLDTYVTDFNALMNVLGSDAILRGVIDAGKLGQAFDVAGLIRTIGYARLLKGVDIKELLVRLDKNDAMRPLLEEIDPDTYIACINTVLNAMHNNVREIKINDIAITNYKDQLLYINVEKLMQAIQVAFPTLEELAELEGDVLIDGLCLSITYIPEGKTETKIYEINATVKLTDGVDRIRETAIKIKNLVNRYLTYTYENNDIVFELRLPDQFATALKETLNSLGAESDPELLALRDELLALYDANLTDTANFIQNLTIEQTVTLLEKVDTAPLTNAYNKLMKQRYVEIVLEYIEKATGKDLADVEIGTLMEELAGLTVPTVEQVAEKLEALTGRDLLSRLPSRVEGAWESAEQRKIAEIFDAIAAKAGLDTDIKQILQNANAANDPLQYLYDEFVNILENSENAYIAIKERVLDVYRRVIASKLGTHFNSYRLDELYTGNGTFKLEESLEINPKTYITRAVDKAIEKLLEGRQANEKFIEDIKTIALGMIDESPISFRVSGALRAEGLYRAAFYDYDATSATGLRLLGEFFLPVGTDLNLLMDYTTGDPLVLFEGWSESGTIYATMPEKDVVLLPKTNDISCTITVYAPGQIGQTPAWGGTGIIGEKLADDVIAILQSKPVTTWDNDTVTWYVVENGDKTDRVWSFADDVLEGDLVLTWEITHATYTVQIVDPDSKEPVTGGAFTVTRGEKLSADQIAAMNALVPAYAYGHTWHLVDENGQIVSAEFDFDTEIHSALKLTWVYNPEPLPEYTITVLDSNGNAVGEPITVEQGTTLESIKAQLLAKTDTAAKGLVPAWYEVATDVESVTASDYIALDATPIMEHYVLTWRYQTITIYDHTDITATPITFELGDDNQGVSIALLTEKAGLDADNLPAWYALSYPNAPTKDSTPFAGSTDKVTWDQAYTWKYFTITYYNSRTEAPVYKIENIGVGKTLADYLTALHATAGATQEKTPAWYAVDSATGELADDAISDFGAVAVNWDLTVAWKYHVVTIHDPSDYNTTVSFELGVGQPLTRDMLETAVGTFAGKHPGWYMVDANGAYEETDKLTTFGEPISSDIDLTWKLHHVNVWDDAGNKLGTLVVGDCDDDGNAIKLESLKAEILTFVTLIEGKTPAWYAASTIGEFNEQSTKLDWTAAVSGDCDIAWKYYDVIIYSPETGEVVKTFVFGDGVKLETVYDEMKALADASDIKFPAWYMTDAELTFTKDDKFTAFDSNVTWDRSLTWKYYTVNVYDYTTDQLITSITLGDGQDFNDAYDVELSYLNYLNSLVALADHPGKVPAWYLYASGNRGAFYQNDLGKALDWDIDLTYHYPVVTVEIWGSTDPDGGEHIHYPNLENNTHLVSYDSTFGALIDQIADQYAGYEEWLLHVQGFEWMSAVYSSFHNEWKQDADGLHDLDETAKIADDVTIRLYIVPDTTRPGISIGGADNHANFDITFAEGILYVTLKEDAWRENESFTLNFINLSAIVSDTHGYGVTFTNEGGTQSVHMSYEMLEALLAVMKDAGASTVTLEYAEISVYSDEFVYEDWTPNAESGALGYRYEFAFDGTPVAGDFFGKREDGKDVIELTFAFSGKGNTSGNGATQTFLYVDGLESNGWITDIQEGSVTVSAQHFSQFMLVNKHTLSYHESTYVWDSSLAGFDLLPFEQMGGIFETDPFVSGYYAKGEPIKVNKDAAFHQTYLGKLTLVKTDMIGANGAILNSKPVNMPDQPAKLQHTISTDVYHVYYYTYNTGSADLAPGYYYAGELAYTRYDAEKLTWSTVSAYLPELLGTGAWFGIDEADWNQCIYGSPKDVYLVWGEDDAPVADVYGVTFKWDDAAGTTFIIENTLVGWLGEGIGSLQGADGLIAAELDRLELVVPNSELVKWSISIGGKTYEISDLTVEQWIKLFNASATTPIVFTASRTERHYTIGTDGNVEILSPGTLARPGDTVTFLPVLREDMAGMVIDRIELYAGDKDISDQISLLSGLGCWSFKMPASDVYIKVIYKTRMLSYIDQSGAAIEGVPYGDRITYTLEIPSSYWIDLTKLDAVIKAFREDLILVGSEKSENGNLVLTYACSLTEGGVDFTVLHAQTTKLINEMIYRAVYVVNGAYYFTEQEALAACPEGVKITWERGFYENMFIASFEKVEAEEETSLVWLIVLLAVLTLILIIAILYVLYICGKLGPNWFLKGITAIVSAFFAVCMGLAHVVMAIIRFVGHEETDLMENEARLSPRPEPENDPTPTDAAPAEENAEEPADATAPAAEVAEEAVEEVTETAEAAEETADPAATTTADEAIEIAVEDVVDETIDEVLTDATEEVTEEVTEETTEEATAEKSEDETEKTNE